MEQWSNQACFGYAILAAEKADITQEQIREMCRKMHCVHDEVTIEEAARYYRESDY
jgi:uncharacterized radical SAM superfamily Fe-S cluster-containing enzyme